MRKLVITAGIIMSIAALFVTFGQRRELSTLKLEQAKRRQLQAEVTEPLAQSTASVVNLSLAQPSPSKELLRLRGEVGQLERRKRELGSVQTENKTLRTQLATKGTNAPGSIVLPVDYIRKADARLAGFNTPEDTFQSMLWAIHNQNVSTFVQAFSPEAAKQMQAEIQRRGSVQEFFKGAEALPGLRIIGKEAGADDTTVMTIEMLPGDENHLQKIHFKQFDGQWKLLSGF